MARLFDEELFKRYMHKIYVDEYCKEFSSDFVPVECDYYKYPDSVVYKEGVVVIDGVDYLVIFTQEQGQRCEEFEVKVSKLH